VTIPSTSIAPQMPLLAGAGVVPTIGPLAEYASHVARARESLARPTAVELRGLTKHFARRRSVLEMLRERGRSPRVTVVDRVSFTVRRGEAFGLLGPNGAGKTTIFKMLATLVVPDEGDATVDGYDLGVEAAAVRRVLCAVPADERSLNWRLSARENLALFAALYRIPRRDAARRVEHVLGVVGLADAGAKLVAAFSSGMRQRLLIARALLGAPRILLLDEPTRSLDPLSAQEFRGFLRRELIDRAGCTIVLATHNAEEAFGFCDRVAVLHQGRLLATGPTGALSGRYGEERYRLVTADASHAAFAALEHRGALAAVQVLAGAEGWSTVECVITGGAPATAQVLRELVERGVRVAGLERVGLSLAELIGRIIAAPPADAEAFDA
jgi:ABC-2 type transport system ATP-binding protein